MLDLNLTYVHEDTITAVRGEMEESATSNSSAMNAEGCSSSNVGDDDSASVAGDDDNFHCFNFDILKVGDTGDLNSNSNGEDRPSQNRSEFVTRTLFQANRGEGRFEPENQVNSLMLLSNNSESVEMGSVHVQQNMPTVQQSHVVRKSRRGPRSRSSQYRGVTFYRRTGRWESHIWDCGKQVYLGGFDTAHAAARSYDRAAIKFRGVDADINFNISDYEEEMNQLKNLSKEDFVHILRRHSGGFSRGGSKYRGVMMNNRGLGEERMGQFLGKKAYENAAMKSNERAVVANFDTNTYAGETVAHHSGNSQNLDLNLRVSTPSCLGIGSSRNENLEHMQLNHGFHNIRSLQVGNPGLPIISEHGQSWTAMGMYPQIIGGSSQGPSNWAWQSHVQSQPSIALFPAASSGFPAPPPNPLNYK